MRLFTSERPMAFFCLLSAVLVLGALGLATPLVLTYLHTGAVPRFPTAILVTGLMLSAFLSFVCGIVLHKVALERKELKHLAYLAVPLRTEP